MAELRGQKVSSSRAWFYRQPVKDRLFAVSHEGRAVIPGFQLTGTGDVRAELTAVIAPLREAGFEGWAIWQWLTSPTAWLSGESPENVAVNDPDRAVTAARRVAATPAV